MQLESPFSFCRATTSKASNTLLALYTIRWTVFCWAGSPLISEHQSGYRSFGLWLFGGGWRLSLPIHNIRKVWSDFRVGNQDYASCFQGQLCWKSCYFEVVRWKKKDPSSWNKKSRYRHLFDTQVALVSKSMAWTRLKSKWWSIYCQH